jgi:hypothetical protein
MDALAAGILVASFRDAWAVVKSLGPDPGAMANGIVAGAVVLAIDAAILLLEQVRSQIQLRGGSSRATDVWALVLILLSAVLNVRYLTQTETMLDRTIGVILGVAIPCTIAVLGYIKGDMLAYNARCRQQDRSGGSPRVESEAGREPARGMEGFRTGERPVAREGKYAAAGEGMAPLFRLRKG